MSSVAIPLVAAALIWWSSTGVLLWLVQGNRATHKWVAAIATVSVLAATACVFALRDVTSVSGAYAGFATGIALWAWHEIMFLFGFVSGPRRTPCPPDLKPWPRFLASTQTVIHHELAIAGHAIIIIALSIGAANSFAALTFVLLWVMRLNSKMVVFFGAPNISDELLPKHLAYLSSYFGKKRVAPLFPVFIAIATAVALTLGYQAVTFQTGSFESTGYLLLAALATLAVLEHWALVLPIPDTALWAWAQRKEQSAVPVTNNETSKYGRV